MWQIFMTSRLPRTVSIVLAGASLSVSGLLMQSMTQNPYAAPSTVGTVEAAQLGLLCALFMFPQASLGQKALFAFVSSLLFTLFFIYFIRQLLFKEKWYLPLVGMVYAGLIGAFAQGIAYHFDLVQSLASWLQGSFAMVQPGQYEWLFFSLLSLFGVWHFAHSFTLMSLGESTSRHLGLDFQKLEVLGLSLIALTTSVTVITVGNLPFLGVIVPNFVRRYYGDHLRNNQGIVALSGAILVLVCDIIARQLIPPYEVSVSLILGIVGATIFILLLWRGALHD